MGGEIAVIKKVNDEIESYEGHTNPLSSVPKQLEFYKDPNNIPLSEYLKNSLHLYIHYLIMDYLKLLRENLYF